MSQFPQSYRYTFQYYFRIFRDFRLRVPQYLSFVLHYERPQKKEIFVSYYGNTATLPSTLPLAAISLCTPERESLILAVSFFFLPPRAQIMMTALNPDEAADMHSTSALPLAPHSDMPFIRTQSQALLNLIRSLSLPPRCQSRDEWS